MSARSRRLWFAVRVLMTAWLLFFGYTAFWPDGISSFWRKTGSLFFLLAWAVCVLAGLLVRRLDAKEDIA